MSLEAAQQLDVVQQDVELSEQQGLEDLLRRQSASSSPSGRPPAIARMTRMTAHPVRAGTVWAAGLERRMPAERVRGNPGCRGGNDLVIQAFLPFRNSPGHTSAGGELTASWDQIPFPSQFWEYFREQTLWKESVPGREFCVLQCEY